MVHTGREERVRPAIGARLPLQDTDRFEEFACNYDVLGRQAAGLVAFWERNDDHSVLPDTAPESEGVDGTGSFTIFPEAVLEPGESVATREPGRLYRTRDFNLYPAEDISLTLAERRWGAKQPSTRARYWSPSDKGRIVGEIQNEIERLPLHEVMDSSGDINIRFDTVRRVGGEKKRGRKLALIPEEGPGYELLCKMHEVTVAILGRHQKGYQYPDDYIPHLTVGSVNLGEITEQKIGKIIKASESLLPLVLRFDKIEFYDSQPLRLI